MKRISRSETLSLRLFARDMQDYREAAQAAGYPLSAWVRRVLTAAAAAILGAGRGTATLTSPAPSATTRSPLTAPPLDGAASSPVSPDGTRTPNGSGRRSRGHDGAHDTPHGQHERTAP